MSKKKTILSVSHADAISPSVRIIEHSQFAKSALQQEKKYLPVAVAYSNFGAMKKELITPILPASGVGRDRLHNIMRTVESSGTIFNEGRLIKLLSMMGSSLLAFHRNALRYSGEIKDYAQFGPLNYIRYITKVTNNLAVLQKADAHVDYEQTNDYILNVMINQFMSIYADYILTPVDGLSSKFVSAYLDDIEYEQLRNPDSWNWAGNPNINRDYTLFYRVIGAECKQRTANWLSKTVGDTDDRSAVNVLIEIANTLWVSIEDMVLTVTGTMMDYQTMNRGKGVPDKQEKDIAYLLADNFATMERSMTFIDMFAFGMFLAVSRVGDVGNSGTVQSQMDKSNYEHILASLKTTDYGDNNYRSSLSSMNLPSDAGDKAISSKIPADFKRISSAVSVMAAYISILNDEDSEGKSFAYDTSYRLLGVLEKTLGLNTGSRDEFETYFTGMGGTISSMLNSDADITKNKLIQYVGVTGRDINTALSELSNHIETIIDGRDSVAAYYSNMEASGREAIKNLPELIREFDATCSLLSAKANKTLATTIVEKFLSGEVWMRSGAQKIYANAYSYVSKPTDADSIMQQMIIDDKVIKAFNDSVFRKFAYLKSASTIFPGHEFALGTNLTVEYDGSIRITGMTTGSFVLNGINGYTDIYNLVTCETKDPKTLERLTNVYNIKLQQCLSDIDVHRDITKASASTLSSHYTFSRDIADTVLPQIQAIEASIRYEIACLKYSMKANIGMYLLGNIDLMNALKIAIEARELSFYSDSGVERIDEMLTEMIGIMTKQLDALNVTEARVRERTNLKGMAPVVVGNSYDISANLDSILAFFNIKANRIWYRDIFLNVNRLIERIDQGRADGRNFVYLTDLDSKLVSAEFSSLTKVVSELEKLDTDVLANLLPSTGLTADVKDTTHRMYDRANFMYAVDLAATFSGNKLGYFGTVDKIVGRLSNLPAGLNKMNIIPQAIINLLTVKLNSKLTERYITSEDVETRLSRLYLMRGPATSAIMKLGTGYGEMAEYNISNEYHSKIAYSVRDALVKILEDAGLHPDNFLMTFEAENFCQYVRSMSVHPNFPLILTDLGRSITKDGFDVNDSSSTAPYLRPQLSEHKIGDVITIKSSIMRSSEDRTGTLYHLNYYTRGEEILKLLNSDIIEFRADLKPSLLAISLRDGLREFYMTQDEVTLVEGYIPADVRYELNGVQAMSVAVSVVEVLYDKIFNEKLVDDGGPSGDGLNKKKVDSDEEEDENKED